MNLLDQSGVTGGGLDPYNVHALFVNIDNMWTERFGNYDCLVIYLLFLTFRSFLNNFDMYQRLSLAEPQKVSSSTASVSELAQSVSHTCVHTIHVTDCSAFIQVRCSGKTYIKPVYMYEAFTS